jgi:O-antigen/teichoic acid export membrane protein
MILGKIKKTISTENSRSKKYKKNIFLLMIYQILSIITSLLLIPITLGYLGIEEYGIWITLTTLISWFAFFDIGLGHGLRNKYAEAKIKNDVDEMKKYVSTAFFSLSIISLLIFVSFAIGSLFINWASILNAPKYLENNLKIISFISAGLFCLRFVISIVTSLLTADQEPSIPALINFAGNILSLIVVYIVTKTTKPSLLYIGIALTVSQLFPLLCAFVYFFSTRYKIVFPSFKYFSKEHIKSLFSLGIRFFLIQITALFLFQSNNIIIAHACGLEEVTSFNIAYKYINILFIAFSTFLTPLWSASTDAYAKGDIAWIKSSMKKLNQLWFLIIFGGIIMIIVSPFVYKLWLKNSIMPNFSLLIFILLYFIFLARSTMYRSFMNGVGKIRLQFYVTFVQSLLHIPLAFFLGKTYGVIGVVFSMLIWAVINSIWEQTQFNFIINNKAKGIWNK